MAKKINLGKVGMTAGGSYQSGKAYERLTCVSYNHESWVSRKDVPAGIAPTEGSEYWQKMASRGVQGPQGQSYVDKELVPIVNNLTTGGSSNVLSAEQGKVLKAELTELESNINGINGIVELSGNTSSIVIELNAGETLDPDKKRFPIVLSKGVLTLSLSVTDAAIGSNSIAVYRYSNGIRTQIGVIKDGETKEFVLETNVEGLCFYLSGSKVLELCTITIDVQQEGQLGKNIENIGLMASRKVERIAYIGSSSAGYDWKVGDKIYNTTRRMLAVCTKVAPNVDFGDDYAPNQESVYIYENRLYRWDGKVMRPIQDNSLILSVMGEVSQELYVESGGNTGDPSVTQYYAMPIIIKAGEIVQIQFTGVLTSMQGIYACSSDGNVTRLIKQSYGYLIPYDIVAIGVYQSPFTETGYYKMIVKKVSLSNLISKVIGQGTLQYWGKKIPSLAIEHTDYLCKEEIIVSEKKTDGNNDNQWASGMAVVKGKIFSFNDVGHNYCMIYDVETRNFIAKVSVPWEAHNNNVQPTPYYYDDSDDYPMLLVSRGDYAGGTQELYVVRVTEANNNWDFAIVKTIQYSNFEGEQYNASWFADYNKAYLYCYTYPNGSWEVVENNPIVIHKFKLPSLINNDDNITLTSNDIIETIRLQDHWITQSALIHNGKIYIETERYNSWASTINGMPYNGELGNHLLMVINEDSGYIETLLPLHDNIEQEGMSIYNGALYVSEKLTDAQSTSVCFQIVKYIFD